MSAWTTAIPWLRRITSSLLLLAAAVAAPTAQADTTNCTAINVLPYVISAPGHYCLGANRTWAGTSGSAISINASNVSLDCNNYVITYSGTSVVNGISAVGRNDLYVRNCTLVNFSRGFVLSANAGVGNRRVILESNSIVGARITGMSLALRDGVVIGNRIIETIGTQAMYVAIDAGGTAVVNENVIRGLNGSSSATGLIIVGKGRAMVGDNHFEAIGAGATTAVGISIQTDATVTPVPAVLDNNYFYLFQGTTNIAVSKSAMAAKSRCTNVAPPVNTTWSPNTGCL